MPNFALSSNWHKACARLVVRGLKQDRRAEHDAVRGIALLPRARSKRHAQRIEHAGIGLGDVPVRLGIHQVDVREPLENGLEDDLSFDA